MKKKVNKEKILFKTSSIIDIKEFKKFYKFYINKFKNTLIWKIGLLLLAVLAIYLNFIHLNFDVVIMILVFLILYPILFNFAINKQIKKIYKSSKKINESEELFTFYDTYVVSKNRICNTKINYEDIYIVCETKTNFYIFISDNQSFILIKNNIDDIDKFRDFIKDKALYKKYR